MGRRNFAEFVADVIDRHGKREFAFGLLVGAVLVAAAVWFESGPPELSFGEASALVLAVVTLFLTLPLAIVALRVARHTDSLVRETRRSVDNTEKLLGKTTEVLNHTDRTLGEYATAEFNLRSATLSALKRQIVDEDQFHVVQEMASWTTGIVLLAELVDPALRRRVYDQSLAPVLVKLDGVDLNPQNAEALGKLRETASKWQNHGEGRERP
jgi:multisubunit Na+/H+ antiporter MnhG subunit